MPEHVHEHDGLASHSHDDASADHTHDDRETVVVEEREAVATAAVTVGPAPGGVAGRILLTLLGAAGMIVGAFVPWIRGSETTGVDRQFSVFFSTGAGESGFITSAGFVLIVLAVLALLGLAFRVGWLTSLAGALGLLAMVLFVITVLRSGGGIGDLSFGTWLSVVGSILALIAGILGSRDRILSTST